MTNAFLPAEDAQVDYGAGQEAGFGFVHAFREMLVSSVNNGRLM